jgi:hypothetical protein
MAEGKPADEDSDAGQDGIEKIERPDRAHAHEVEKRALYAQLSERLVQAFEHSICALLLLRFVRHSSSSRR